ncbi:MAG: hypothetical protein V4436_03760 [Patescibacteria group bacterium]
MADENGGDGGTDIDMLLFVFGGFAALVAIWYFTGGASKADLRGIFLNPPAPIDNGDAYGPQITPKNTTNTNTNQ